jgi:hypothetical protein
VGLEFPFANLATSSGGRVEVLRVLVLSRGEPRETVWSFEYHTERPMWDTAGLLADAAELWAQLRAEAGRVGATSALVRACAEDWPPSGNEDDEFFDVVYTKQGDDWSRESYKKSPPPAA